MSAGGEFLRVSDLHAFYGQSHILHGVDLTVNEGEIVSVIGPNGAGKTTFFNLVSGLYQPVEGDILFEGKSIVGKATNANFISRSIARNARRTRSKMKGGFTSAARTRIALRNFAKA